MADLPVYTIDRSFNAPRALVWKAWTDPQLLAQWYGPGIETIIHRFDLRPGGEWRNEMRWGEKSDLSKMVFEEVTPPEKLVWRHSSVNTDWDVARNPMMPDWPRTLRATVSFKGTDGRTDVRLTMTPVGASETEIACFANAMAGMDKGWGSGFAMLEKLLSSL